MERQQNRKRRLDIDSSNWCCCRGCCFLCNSDDIGRFGSCCKCKRSSHFQEKVRRETSSSLLSSSFGACPATALFPRPRLRVLAPAPMPRPPQPPRFTPTGTSRSICSTATSTSSSSASAAVTVVVARLVVSNSFTT